MLEETVKVSRVYRVATVQRMLGGVADETIYRYLRTGRLKGVKPAGIWLIYAESVEQFLKDDKVGVRGK